MSNRLRAPLAFLVALVASVSVANCYAPELENCTLACDSQNGCPDGQHCDHGFCTSLASSCEPDVPSGGASAGVGGGAGAGGLASSGGTGGDGNSSGGTSPYSGVLFVNETYPGGNGWIELYNASAVTMRLEGFRILYQEAQVSNPFGDVSIPPGGYLVLYGTEDFDVDWKFNFLGTREITLLDDSGETVDVFVWAQDSVILSVGYSVCRYPDGGDERLNCVNSIGVSNPNPLG